jgi:methylmalonyl-CoA mutase C-terminal domain/subunit
VTDSRPSRALLAKLGLDGHDVGVLWVAKLLRDEGFEVIYLGKRRTTAEIVAVAVDEDVDVVGLSCLSGGLGHFAREVVAGLAEQGTDIPVIAGGIDEPDELARTLEAGVVAYFGPGTTSDQIIAEFRGHARKSVCAE